MPPAYHARMTNPMTILCPGQGAQAVGMGKAWASAHPESRATQELAGQTAGPATASSGGR